MLKYLRLVYTSVSISIDYRADGFPSLYKKSPKGLDRKFRIYARIYLALLYKPCIAGKDEHESNVRSLDTVIQVIVFLAPGNSDFVLQSFFPSSFSHLK